MKRFLACAVVLAGLLGCKPGKPLHTTYKGSPTEVDTFPGRVTAMALDPTTGNLALGFSDSLVSIWNPTAHKAVLQIRKHRHIINGVAFSPDGKLLAAASADEVFTISDARTGQLIDSVVMFQGPVTNVDFSSDGKYLAIGFADKIVDIWDVAKRERYGEFKGHEGVVTALRFRPSSDVIYTAGRDSFLFIADVTDSVSFKTKESNGYINAMAFTGDGSLFAAGGTNNLVKVWNTDPLNSIGWYESDLKNVLALAFLSDKKTLIAADGSGQIVFLRITSPSDTTEIQKGIFTVGVSEMGRFRAHDGAVRGIVLSADDSKLYTGGDDRTLKTWDVRAILDYFASQAPEQK